MGRPMLMLAAAVACGSLAGGALPIGAALILLAAAASLLLSASAAAPRSACVALAGAGVALGAAGAGIETRTYEAAPLRRWIEARGDTDEPTRIGAVASSDARDTGDRLILVLDVETIAVGRREWPARGRVRIHVGGMARRPEIIEGDRVSLWATLRRPSGFGNPGSFDAEGEALRAGVHASGFCKSALLVERGGRDARSSLSATAALARAWARARIRTFVLPGPEQGLLRAMTLGDRTGVDPDTAEAFRVAGTYHVLAISGAQVALLAGGLLFGARRLGATPAATALVVSAGLAFYAAFVGGETPVVRAAVMAIVMLVGRALDLDSDLANLLGLAALLLLVQRPSAVLDVAFQLSFVATLGILLLTEPLKAWLPRLPLRLDLALAASLAAQLPLAPLLALHFHRLAPAALVLNLLAVPLSGAVLLAGLGLLLATALAPVLAPAMGDLAWMAAHALLRSSDVVRLLPALDVRVPSPPAWALALLVAGLALLRRKQAKGLALATLACAGFTRGPATPTGDGRLQLTVLDVGQGDALVLRSPSGRVCVIDAGGAYQSGFELGEAVVGPYLWSQGVRRVDRLLLTHAHPDHVGGAPFLAKAFGAGEVWEGPAPWRGSDRALELGLKRSGTARLSVARGARVSWDGVALEVLGPRGRDNALRTRNDDSVVLAVTFGDVRLLLAGDIEALGEAELPPWAATVLKVPHHGSRTSSSQAFVDATAPRVAIISVGRRNRFGHPDGEVIERYLRRGARLYRTDRDGAVTVATDGARLWVTTFRDGGAERGI